MPTQPSLALRVYRRLWPIVRLQWRTAHGRGARARLAISLVQLFGSDLLLAVVQRLRRLATRPVPIYVNGLVHYVDLHANEIVPLFEIYEGGMYGRVPGFAGGPGQIVVDIGANIGAFTLWQAQRGATVYAYEPNPDSFARLSKAIAHNGLENKVHAAQAAVGAIVGRGTLIVPDENSTAGTLHTGVTGPIQVTTLPALCDTLGLTKIDILKIDAEGSEASILEAAGMVLDHVHHLVLEYHSAPLEEQSRRILESHGFIILERTVVDADAGGGVLYAHRSANGAGT